MSIEVVENHDDSSYLNRAEALIGNIISSQSTNVDVISGATYSSNGIKSAVRDALRQAAVSGNSQSVNAKTEDTSKTEDNTTVKGNFPYKEGIYYGTAEGYNGEIEVAVVQMCIRDRYKRIAQGCVYFRESTTEVHTLFRYRTSEG